MSFKRYALSLLFVGIGVTWLGCGGRVPEPLEFPSELRTLDGLRQVESDGAALVFVRPGVRMADFDQVLVDPFMLSYTSPDALPSGRVRTLGRETEERFVNVVRDAFISTMTHSRDFELVEQPGPAAIRVQGWLFDVVVAEPPTDDPRNLSLCFAEVTVLLTVRHSVTAQALAQVAERTRLTCKTDPRAQYQTVGWSVVRRGVRPWAKFLRRWLEDLKRLPPVPE